MASDAQTGQATVESRSWQANIPCEPTINEAVLSIAQAFEGQVGQSARIDARLIVAEACRLDGADLFGLRDRVVSPSERERLIALCTRRLEGEPVSRIRGWRDFWTGRFEIGPATLDPRADSECLVEAAITLLDREKRQGTALEIADLGTGSGALLISLLGEFVHARGLGTDLSAAALEIARRNAFGHGVGGRAEFLATSWLDGVERRFDLIVCNPPYIAHGDIATLDREVREHDPHMALDGGSDGLDAYRQIAPVLATHLVPGGLAVVEMGQGQDGAVIRLMQESGLTVVQGRGDIGRDLVGHVRCIAVRNEAEAAKKLLECR